MDRWRRKPVQPDRPLISSLRCCTFSAPIVWNAPARWRAPVLGAAPARALSCPCWVKCPGWRRRLHSPRVRRKLQQALPPARRPTRSRAGRGSPQLCRCRRKPSRPSRSTMKCSGSTFVAVDLLRRPYPSVAHSMIRNSFASARSRIFCTRSY